MRPNSTIVVHCAMREDDGGLFPPLELKKLGECYASKSAKRTSEFLP